MVASEYGHTLSKACIMNAFLIVFNALYDMWVEVSIDLSYKCIVYSSFGHLSITPLVAVIYDGIVTNSAVKNILVSRSVCNASLAGIKLGIDLIRSKYFLGTPTKTIFWLSSVVRKHVKAVHAALNSSLFTGTHPDNSM